MSTWAPSGYSHFLPWFKDTLVRLFRLLWDFKWPISVNECVCGSPNVSPVMNLDLCVPCLHLMSAGNLQFFVG